MNRIQNLLNSEQIYPASHIVYTMLLNNWKNLEQKVKDRTIDDIILNFRIWSLTSKR